MKPVFLSLRYQPQSADIEVMTDTTEDPPAADGADVPEGVEPPTDADLLAYLKAEGWPT